MPTKAPGREMGVSSLRTGLQKMVAVVLLLLIVSGAVLVLINSGRQASNRGEMNLYDQRDVIYNAHRAQTEAQIKSQYGEPIEEFASCRLLGPRMPSQIPDRPVRTIVFRVGSGKLYVWLWQNDSTWDCFESCWVNDGVCF